MFIVFIFLFLAVFVWILFVCPFVQLRLLGYFRIRQFLFAYCYIDVNSRTCQCTDFFFFFL